MTIPQITIKCKDADGYKNKDEVDNCYDWKESGAGKEKLYYQNFGCALKGEPSKTVQDSII